MLDPDDIDLSELGSLLDQRDWGAGYFDPSTGEVIHAFDGEVLGPDGEPIDLEIVDWIALGGDGSRDAYRDMESFAAAVADRRLAERLDDALAGKGAFRRFRDLIHHQPKELGKVWHRYRDARQALRALDWLVAGGLVGEEAILAREAQLRRTAEDALREVAADPAAAARLDEVMGLERELQTRACRRDPARLRALLADDFSEVGASGRVWDLESTLEHVGSEQDGDEIEVHDLSARTVTDDLVLVQWVSVRGGRRARRTSLWRQEPDGWRLVHHQGTLLG